MKTYIQNHLRVLPCLFVIILTASCEKTEITNKQENNGNQIIAFMRADYFDYMGQVYSVADYPELFEREGGPFWYYDADGTKHWYFPYNGNPYFRPPYNQNDSITDPINPTQSIGKFIHNSIKDIMNASSIEAQSIISSNLELPYNPLISLSAKISGNLLNQVADGVLSVGDISETVIENESQINYNYIIHFQNFLGFDVETTNIEFCYQLGCPVADSNR